MFTRSSRHYQGIMTSFISFCIILITVCVNPLSAVPEVTVSGHVGSTAVLPCELQSEDTGTPHIKWQIRSETVFERSGEKTHQGEGYEERVDVPVEDLHKGNCSLVLRNLKLTDAAVYRSSQISVTAKEISHVYLSVIDNLNEENKAEQEVLRESKATEELQQETTRLSSDFYRSVWIGVGTFLGIFGVIVVIGVIVAVLYVIKRKRIRIHRNPDPPQTIWLPNTQINPAHTSQGSVVLENGVQYHPFDTRIDYINLHHKS